MSRQPHPPLPISKLLLIHATSSQAPAVPAQLLASVAVARALPGCTGGQVHISQRSAQHWIVQLHWLDQTALQKSIDEVWQPLLQCLLDGGTIRAIQVYGGDELPPQDLLDDIETSS
ncbi:hypothetical protein [Pseudomonas chlororaphis]|uniref:hypothetical protein n=1 Tax=Pseudomonas chlororaphis TaxID=587753 RepID=UPI0003D2E843|nr:hypothetical protein [Pseudomonas chlororaphis]AZD30407.1 hypothetical protein C4K23_3661 [Pseudomonas chlororaphis]ETD40673.1 hypothetical protein U724_01790 [Pseudomonas chlororaphis subsp. aurantiaca PB-St2]QFS55789.1 hypothetical protein FD951_15020 [Pseudomonas chlororaphis subsp. aurantiaca]